MDWCTIQGTFLIGAQRFWDRFQVHHHFDEDKGLTEDEWINQ